MAEKITFNGENVHTRCVACDAVVDPVGQADEEQGGASEHLGYDVLYWGNIQGDIERICEGHEQLHPPQSQCDGDDEDEDEEGRVDCVDAVCEVRSGEFESILTRRVVTLSPLKYSSTKNSAKLPKASSRVLPLSRFPEGKTF